MNHRKSLISLTAGAIALLFTSSSIFAAEVVRKFASTDPVQLIQPFLQFAADLGGGSHPDGGSYTTGYRLINWDDVPENMAGVPLPTNFFNTTFPRGVVLSSACTQDQFIVSAGPGSGVPLHFGNFNANYTNDFQEFSPYRLFSGLIGGCNYIDFYFFIPGTKIPATVKGFGVVFLDVDNNQSAGMICYGVDGQPLAFRQNALGSNNGLSLLGVSYNAGERIAHVRIFNGNGVLGDVDMSRGGSFDVVVMDNIIYGEPHAIGQHPADFDGDGTSDMAVFRPTNGSWYVMQSGSNTFVATQFGQAGDVPIDGDFDGDSFNDLTVFRPSNGAWYTQRTSNGQFQGRIFGLNGDKPVAGDYDKDSITDIAVWRPSNGNYYYLKSSNGQLVGSHFGAAGDIPVGYSAP